MDSNSQSTGGLCLAIVIFGILFIFGPIVITFTVLTSGYLSVIMLYVWVMIAMIACFVFVQDNTAKFVSAGMIVFIFACVFCSWYFEYELRGNYDDGGLSDLIGMFVYSFTLMVPCCFVGIFIEKNLKVYKHNKNEARKNRISNEIRSLMADNDALTVKISTHRRELKLLNLLEKCGGDITVMVGNHQFADIVKIEERINNNTQKVSELKKQLEKI